MTIINVFVTSPDTHSERRLESSLTIAQLKDKLTPITGIAPHYQVLRLFSSAEDGRLLGALDDESRTLESYSVQEYNCIKIDNTDPNARPGEFSDLSAVDKFELTPEEYEARNDTVLAHLKANKLGRFADVPVNLTHPPPPPSSADPSIVPGARCEISHGAGESSQGLAKRGTVRFVGEASIGKGGVWVGVELDEPLGKGDGEVEGERYFTCLPKHATFVRPEKVVIGDFPEEDLMMDADDDDEI